MKLDRINQNDFLLSLNIDNNINNIFRSGQGSGKSGSFFFFTSDNQYLIKTMKGNERQNLIDMLDDIIEHFGEN